MIFPKPLTRPSTARSANRFPDRSRVSAQPLWAWIAVLLPVAVFALVWQYYAVNVPKWDDHVVRAYLYFWDQETTLTGKIYQLFKQHNEHRIVYDRIVASFDYWLFGKLSYVHLMVMGKLSLVGLLAVFGAVLLRAGKPLPYLVPVSLLLFNLSHWENMFWGMAALQNFSVVLWVVLTIYLLSYTDRWGLALASAMLATLTSGNGLLVWPLGLVLLVLRPTNGPSLVAGPVRWRLSPLISWAVSAAVVIGLYFVGFEKPAGNPPLRGTAVDLFKGWLAFTGAAAEVLTLGPPLRASALLGGLMVLVTLGLVAWGVLTQWATLTRLLRRIGPSRRSGFGTARTLPPTVLFFWGCAGFLLGTAAIVAWTRTGFGIDLLTTSRYKIYSLTLLALLYVYVLVTLPERMGRRVGVAGGLGGLLLAWLSYNSFLDETIGLRHQLLTNQFNATHGTNQPVSRVDAVSARYTTLAPAFYDADPAVLYSAGQSAVMPVTMTRTVINVELGQATLPAGDNRDGRAFVVVRSPKRAYLFPTRQRQALGGRTLFWPANPFTSGFTATVTPAHLDAGTYRVFILTMATDGQLTLHPTGRTITSTGPAEAPLKKNW